jgi:PHD/YefM family antitoxin component YafN of YafNO toxin-antitoxin module
MGEYTTVLVHKETKQRLEEMKEYAKESYDEIINKLITITKLMESEGRLNEGALRDIAEAREQVRKGKGMSTKELMAKLGV